MAHDWLLVETLGFETTGDEPVVVAQADQLKNLVPITVFLRRSPHLESIRAAVVSTVAAATAQRCRSADGARVIHTEPVVMSDARVHGVHVWLGLPGDEPPPRAVPGPLIWNLTTRMATNTIQSLVNSGLNPDHERTHDRMFAEDLPTRDLNASETKILSLAVQNQPGATFCNTWNVTARDGESITVGFVARTGLEQAPDGGEHLVARAMNWRSRRHTPAPAQDSLAQRILDGLARPGSYRGLVDINTWTLLKWLDEPCPLYDWRGRAGMPKVHPDDAGLIEAMTSELDTGVTERVLRLPGHDADWIPMHVTVHRIELEPGTFAGLITLRTP